MKQRINSGVFGALAVAILVASSAMPALSIEDASSRRARVEREAQGLPNLALEALNKQDADTAIDLYTKALKSGAFRAQPDMLGQIYLGRAMAYRLKKDCTSAVADFDKAAEYVKKGDVFYGRAACRIDMGQEDLALADLGLAIEADPEAPGYRKVRCVILFNRKDFANALPDCEKALVSAPNDKTLLLAASQAAEQTGNRPRAAELYRNLQKADPGNTVATEGLKRVGG